MREGSSNPSDCSWSDNRALVASGQVEGGHCATYKDKVRVRTKLAQAENPHLKSKE